jgi:hypothetical protein
MTTLHHEYTQGARVFLTTARCERVRASHNAVPRLHEGWLRIASVLQPLRWWGHVGGCRSRGITPAPRACGVFRY